MFEEMTYENLLQEVLDNAPDDIDTRQGSIFYDAVSGMTLKIAKLYTDIEMTAKMTSVTNAFGEALDAKASEYGLVRLAATRAKYHAVLEGKTPEVGERFFHDGSYFTLENDGKVNYFQAEIAGESQNDVLPGTQAVPVDHVEGLTSAKFGAIYENGSDAEINENLRTRILEKIAGPAENGNKQHYKTWCESIEGVGRARIFPLWNGENTVKAVLIDSSGNPLGAAKVAEVQNYIDPSDKGMTAVVDGREYVVGDGLGNGVANIGAHFTAAAAEYLDITVTFSAEFAPGMTAENVSQEAADELEKYLKDLALSDENTAVTVRLSAVGALLSKLKSLTDYSNLKLNGKANNITVSGDDVPVLSEVRIE